MRPQKTLRLAISALLGCAVLLLGSGLSAPVQRGQIYGFPEDWTQHHVVFSNPGTLQEALKNGTYDRWMRIVNDPRYLIQQMKSNAGPPPLGDGGGQIIIGGSLRTKGLLHSDWTVALSGGGNQGVATGHYAAKYTFSPIGQPDCVADFVVFPINASGKSGSQANLLGVNNLYNTTCSGTVPKVLFAYFVGTGDVQTSPVLSLDGTKVAFVESVTGGSIFHVLTIGTTGSNGTAYNSPAVPGTGNNAVDTKVTMSNGVSVSNSSPFVDYTNDIAYVGDDTGRVHKFTGVFNGTPAEAGLPWPFSIPISPTLTGPTYDSISRNIFVGGSNGNLYCVTSTGIACSTASVSVGSGATPAIVDAPLVDSTNQTVFATAGTATNLVQVQATTALSSQVTAAIGKNTAKSDYNGAFDSAYFANVSTGHLYQCGNDSSGNPTLLRLSFNAAGTMNSAPDAGSFALSTGTVECAPLTEIFNTSQGKDYLFVGIFDHGFSTGTPNCNNTACIASFVLPTSSPFTFPTVANATTTTNLGTHGMSGFIIDNVSGLAGASQLYFGNPQNQTGVQISQSALQ
jgi:hypothetical protein